jgi:hypothetical protein
MVLSSIDRRLMRSTETVAHIPNDDENGGIRKVERRRTCRFRHLHLYCLPITIPISIYLRSDAVDDIGT